jgi:hypothetical protein
MSYEKVEWRNRCIGCVVVRERMPLPHVAEHVDHAVHDATTQLTGQQPKPQLTQTPVSAEKNRTPRTIRLEPDPLRQIWHCNHEILLQIEGDRQFQIFGNVIPDARARTSRWEDSTRQESQNTKFDHTRSFFTLNVHQSNLLASMDTIARAPSLLSSFCISAEQFCQEKYELACRCARETQA